MKFSYKNLLMNEADDNGASGGGGEPPNQNSAAPTQNDPATEGEGDNLDEFGYEKKPAEPPKQEGTNNQEGNPPKKPQQPPPAKKDEPVKDPATGYNAEPPKVVEPVVEPPKKEEIKLDYELDTKELPEDRADRLKKYFSKYKIAKEAAQEIVNDEKAEHAREQQQISQFKAEREKQITQTKANWYHELNNDPDFGKENFDHNVRVVEKVLGDFMPNFKKVLTEEKRMLPPYLMRDLAKLGKTLYSTPELKNGEPNGPEPEPENQDDHLSFYTQGS